MTRSGPFNGIKITQNGNVKGKELLIKCWDIIGDHLIEVNNSVLESCYPRDRYLLKLSKPKREKLMAKIWLALLQKGQK